MDLSPRQALSAALPKFETAHRMPRQCAQLFASEVLWSPLPKVWCCRIAGIEVDFDAKTGRSTGRQMLLQDPAFARLECGVAWPARRVRKPTIAGKLRFEQMRADEATAVDANLVA